MANISLSTIKLPPYEGIEICYEDVIYSYFRAILNEKGYSFKVKRTGFPEIDTILPSYNSGTIGKGQCDGYIFANHNYESFVGLLELESTGKIEDGVKQIKTYIEGFVDDTLSDSQKNKIKRIIKRDVVLIVYDGQKIYLSTYNLDNKFENIIFDIEPLNQLADVNKKLFSLFPNKEIVDKDIDEKNIIQTVATLIRGHEKLQKNKAILMTILASIYGVTKTDNLNGAIEILKRSQVDYEKKIYETWDKLQGEIDNENDANKIDLLYEKTASQMYRLSQDKGMDLYGFIYEELATKENKREQGEYYTPRHTIKPIISGVFSNYLKWEKDELEKKIIFDPFCGSGGFLYEYIHLLKTIFNFNTDELNNIAKESILACDKNSVLAAYLNLFLIGDGEANIRQVKTSINWKSNFLYKNHPNKKYDVIKIAEKAALKQNIRSQTEDISYFLKLYVDKDFKFNINEFERFIDDHDPLNAYILSTENKNRDYLGNVDLLMTNVPYGKITESTQQVIENGKKSYGSSLEANALRECIDFLKPSKLKNNKRIEEGGIGIIIIPDSILENPTNKPIRDYLIKRCDILGIISLPQYTFSPYAMEKTYALIIQKIAPEEFRDNRNLDETFGTFMFCSICDGRANSENRYPTNHVQQVTIKTPDNKTRKIVEFIHNDFEPCFESYDMNEMRYISKVERAWDSQTYKNNPDWGQERVTEVWNKDNWKIIDGKKWGYFNLVRIIREKKEIINKGQKHNELTIKIREFLYKLDEDERSEYLKGMDYDILKDKILSEVKLTPKEKNIIQSINCIEERKDSDEPTISLIKFKNILDVDLNPDSPNYLGKKEKIIRIEDVISDISNMQDVTEEMIIEYFRNKFISNDLKPIKLMDMFDIIQGTQFSKHDAYLNIGTIPVFTAATDGAAYYVAENIKGKVKAKAPSLIWSRKGAKAGTIQIFDEQDTDGNYKEFYISDVSGTIKPKECLKNYNLLFLKYYIAGQVKRELQSKSGNTQLNKTKLENLAILLPDNQDEIAKVISMRLSYQTSTN